MQLFFITLLNAGNAVEDDGEGVMLPDFMTAKNLVEDTARLVMMDAAPLGHPYDDISFEIRNAVGDLLTTIRCSDHPASGEQRDVASPPPAR